MNDMFILKMLWKYIALSLSYFESSYLFLSFSNIGHFHWLHSIHIGVGGILEADSLGKCGIFSRFNSFFLTECCSDHYSYKTKL